MTNKALSLHFNAVVAFQQIFTGSICGHAPPGCFKLFPHEWQAVFDDQFPLLESETPGVELARSLILGASGRVSGAADT